MKFDQEVEWLATDKPFEKGKNIGLSQKEYDDWKLNKVRVLEVGTGTRGSALKELVEDHIDCIGLEPGVLYADPDELYAEYKTDVVLKERVAALNAGDAADHSDVKIKGKVDYIFAQSANFAQYTKSEFDLFNQILGLMLVLKTNKHSYLTFEVKNEKAMINFRSDAPSFNLNEFLLSINAKFFFRKNQYGNTYIVINRINDQEKDIVYDLERALNLP